MSYLTNPQEQCRDIATLEAITEARVRAWLKAVDRKYDVIITETRRTRARQRHLYTIGRRGRKNEGIVTFVSSDQSFHRFDMAADVCPIRNGKVAYELMDEIIRDFPPAKFGLAVLAFERVHLQRDFPGHNPNTLPASSAAKIAKVKLFNP